MGVKEREGGERRGGNGRELDDDDAERSDKNRKQGVSVPE